LGDDKAYAISKAIEPLAFEFMFAGGRFSAIDLIVRRTDGTLENALLPSAHALDISEPMLRQAAEAHLKFNCDVSLSPFDQLLGYFIHQAKMDPLAAVDAYFQGGIKDASSVIALMKDLELDVNSAQTLEFAAGFGRVTRHLKNLLPAENLVTSDVHSDACRFLSDVLSVTTIQSAPRPADFQTDAKFDFITCLSFFSHIPEALFGPWIGALYSCLKPGGYLMITTHGEHALEQVPEFFGVNYDPVRGFGYRSESDQQDIPSEFYGTAVVSDAYVKQVAEEFALGSSLVGHSRGKWFGLQDHWVIKRPLS
jgi:SAM-dependent methyltransferase